MVTVANPLPTEAPAWPRTPTEVAVVTIEAVEASPQISETRVDVSLGMWILVQAGPGICPDLLQAVPMGEQEGGEADPRAGGSPVPKPPSVSFLLDVTPFLPVQGPGCLHPPSTKTPL